MNNRETWFGLWKLAEVSWRRAVQGNWSHGDLSAGQRQAREGLEEREKDSSVMEHRPGRTWSHALRARGSEKRTGVMGGYSCQRGRKKEAVLF